MKIYGYDLNVVCTNVWEGTYGDIYDDIEECLNEHPDSNVIYGFHLNHNNIETPDWFDTVKDAFDWAVNHPVNSFLKEAKL